MKYRNIIGGALMLLVSSCSLSEHPIDFIDKGKFYKTEKDLLLSVNAAYADLATPQYYGNQFTGALWSYNDYGKGTEGPNTCTQFMTAELLPSHLWLNNIWAIIYTGINRANNTIIYGEANNKLDPEITKRIIGEAKFLRAWNYFNLVRCFGEVPLRLVPATSENMNLPLSSIEDIYLQIIEDLKYAEENCWNRGEKRGAYTNDLGRVTQLAAKTCLAKVYLTIASSARTALTPGFTDSGYPGVNGKYKVFENYKEYYQLCVNKCKEGLNHSDFALETDWSTLWDNSNKNPREVLFSVQYAAIPGYGNNLPFMFLPKMSTLGGSPTQQGSLYRIVGPFLQVSKDLYEDNDYRFNAGCATRIDFKDGRPSEVWKFNKKNEGQYYIEKTGVKGTGGGAAKHLCINKYIDPKTTDPYNSDCNNVLLRSVDLYLMKAEAEAELIEQPTAGFEDLNAARGRLEGISHIDYAYLGKIQGKTNMEKFRNLIMRERVQEFIGEHDRFFTLQRMGKYIEKCNLVGKKFAHKMREDISVYNWPLPMDEIESNSALKDLRTHNNN